MTGIWKCDLGTLDQIRRECTYGMATRPVASINPQTAIFSNALHSGLEKPFYQTTLTI